MPDAAHHITGYQFSAADKLFFDANVWLFIYSPQYRPSDQRAGLYSAAYKRILEVQCRIFVDALILSEFVNVLARLAFHSLPSPQKPQDYKAFRRSPAFKPVARSIADACRRIVEACTRIESGFASVDVDVLLERYEGGKADFNDQILAQLCNRQGLTLVTDDGDFRDSGLQIVTANRRLLT